MSRAKTEEEIRDEFLQYVHDMVHYWANEVSTTDITGKLEGLAFSILVAIDGGADCIPGYELKPLPTEEDDYGKNSPDIGGCLHELFFRTDKNQ